MAKRRSTDLALAAILTPIWLAAFAIHLDLAFDGRLVWFPLYVSPASGPGDFPELRGYWPEIPESRQSLRPRDRILALGGRDLAGAGRFEVLASALEKASPERVEASIERGGHRSNVEIELVPQQLPWRTVPLAGGLGIAAIFALVRSRGRRSVRAFALAAMTYSLVWLPPFGGAPWQTGLGVALFAIAGGLFMPFTLTAAAMIPEPLPSSAARVWPWSFAVSSPLLVGWMLDFPLRGDLAVRLLVGTYVVFTLALLGTLAYQYRRADSRGRRQLKWVALGFYLGLAPALAMAAVSFVDPSLRWLYELSLIATPLIPICVLIGIVRESFLDIDRILTVTATYSLVAPLGVGLVLTLGPPAAKWISEATGLGYLAALWLVAVALVAPGEPLARAARPWIERLVSSDRIRLQERLRGIRDELRSDQGQGELLHAFGARVAAVLELDQSAVYAELDDSFAAVFSHGPLVPPALSAEASLVRLLRAAPGSIGADEWRRWQRARALDARDAAALETLGARVLIPIRRREGLIAFACLGEKRTGDDFSLGELAALEALAERLRAQLELRESDRLADELRSYVPDPIARELVRGTDLDLGEIEVSVLFVDMRGYTNISESRSAREVFAITSAYTTLVSEQVARFGGIIVEFQGDGLMAVFGALTDQTGKEARAVAAARAILASLASSAIGDLPPGGVEAGVGIATGPAFVGNLHSAGQKVWSVMGNTTNVAARLESLTRTLDSSIVVDQTTHARAEAQTAGFVAHEGIALKGRSGTFLVHAAPRNLAA